MNLPMKEYRQENLSIKGECSIFNNTIQINSNKKSKISTITLDSKSNLISIASKGSQQILRFPILKLKIIHRKFIEEGKITLEFDSQVEGTISKGFDIANDIQNAGNYQVFIGNASKENLELFVNRLIELKKSKAAHTPNNNIPKKGESISTNKQSLNQVDEPRISRRQILNLIKNQGKIPTRKPKRQQPISLPKPNTLNLADLPLVLLNQIFSFTGLSLHHRLISKQLEQYILKNIMRIKLQEQIDEETFNKICKWAINVQCRMKYVKNLNLSNRYDCKELVKNRAKSLYFGQWKEISMKNIEQLKGLKIYCLQIPYSIKFQLSTLCGVRLVELRLVGKDVAVRNSMVKDEDLLYLINNIEELKIVEVAYASSKLLLGIKRPQKMQQISIGTLNTLNIEGNWADFTIFPNLQTLSICTLLKNGIPDGSPYILQWPPSLLHLSIGFNLSLQFIPESLTYLKLLHERFTNNHLLRDLYLPQLKVLDITCAINLTPECLQNLRNVKVITNWDRNRVEHSQNYYTVENLEIVSIRGFGSC